MKPTADAIRHRFTRSVVTSFAPLRPSLTVHLPPRALMPPGRSAEIDSYSVPLGTRKG